MAGSNDFGDVFRHAPHHDAALCFEHGHVGTALAGAGGKLQADKTSTDDDNAGSRLKSRANGERIVETAQIAQCLLPAAKGSDRGTAPVASRSRS